MATKKRAKSKRKTVTRPKVKRRTIKRSTVKRRTIKRSTVKKSKSTATLEKKIAELFAHFLENDKVDRFYLPGISAINFLLHDALGGGGTSSLRNDPQGKGYAQILLSCKLFIPRSLII